MAVQTITYNNKVTLNENTSVADVNKCKAGDMNEIKAVVNNNAGVLSNTTTYSTSETNTNQVWVDNKPIYRKTFVYTGAITQGADNLIGSISNADTVIKIDGMAKIASDVTLWWMIPRVTNTGSTSTNWAIDVKISNNDVYVVKSTYGTIEKIILTVEYTKTS